MDLKGEPQTLEQQSEHRLYYTDHPLKLGFSKLSEPLAFNHLKTDFLPFPKKDEVESHPVKEYTEGRILQNAGDIFSHISCTE